MVQSVAGVVLGAVFVTSGLLKVRDPSWPAAARAFGTPGLLVPVVPWAEVAVGVAAAAGFAVGAIGALALLAAFSALIAVHLFRHDAVPCACFGRASTRPVRPAHLVRNAVLAALAVVALR